MSGSGVSVLIPAAGLSTRFGRNKLHEMLLGRSVMRRTLEAFLHRPDTASVIVALPAGVAADATLPDDVKLLLAGPDARHVRLIDGGATRAHSVRAALAAADTLWVAVHDAARPLVSDALIARVYADAERHGSAVPALPVKLTIKQAQGPLPARVARTLPRADLWEMQTPQVMRRDDLIAAYAACPLPLDAVTDDAQVLEAAGFAVWLVPGEERNLKLTTPGDVATAIYLLNRKTA